VKIHTSRQEVTSDLMDVSVDARITSSSPIVP
jgi:hypothetical protein